MATTASQDLHPNTSGGRLPPLLEGEQLDQQSFHERYEAMPAHVRAELIGGFVHIMASPVRILHSQPHVAVINWLSDFAEHAPGVEVLDNATIILNEENEPQPDSGLILFASHGGQTIIDEDDYIPGAPELLVEISISTASHDLSPRKGEYRRAGVGEHIVVLPDEVRWFYLMDGRYHEMAPDPDGILRSIQFPGLWLDSRALLRRDRGRVRAVVHEGIASPGHQDWTARTSPVEEE